MGQAAAKQGDTVTATDMHEEANPSPPPDTVIVPHSFDGSIDGALSSDVNVEGKPAATVDSTATNSPPHIPTTSFTNPPDNQATITTGSATVRINGKAAARDGDSAQTCDEVAPTAIGTVVASSTVSIG